MSVVDFDTWILSEIGTDPTTDVRPETARASLVMCPSHVIASWIFADVHMLLAAGYICEPPSEGRQAIWDYVFPGVWAGCRSRALFFNGLMASQTGTNILC